jgi:hypothetical protein
LLDGRSPVAPSLRTSLTGCPLCIGRPFLIVGSLLASVRGSALRYGRTNTKAHRILSVVVARQPLVITPRVLTRLSQQEHTHERGGE